jgi:ubiquitin C-terminal hydrolase
MIGAGNIGLVNLGNSCYINSIIQCLSNIPQIRNYFLKNNNEGISGEFGSLIKSIWEKNPTFNELNPIIFKNKIGKKYELFNNRNQQDSQEFLIKLLENFNQKLQDFFYFEIKHKRSPLLSREESKCKGEKEDKIISNKNLMLPLNFDFWKKDFTINILISNYFNYTTTEMHCCNKCKENIEYLLEISINKLPKILVVHLLRFGTDEEKINTKIDIPLDLDLREYYENKNESIKYKLVATSNHIGNTARSGHYTAYCLGTNNTWRSFNDKYVNEIKNIEKKLKGNTEAYLLFYTLSK